MTTRRKLTHLDKQGHAQMVDVGAKAITKRVAIASARLCTRPEVIELIRAGRLPKGDVQAVARVAGIMAAKKTAELIPLCHPLNIDSATVDFSLEREAINIRATVKNTGPTGVEMEALTAASVAALAVYDMCKAVDRAMVIEMVRLEKKSGGKSGVFVAPKTKV